MLAAGRGFESSRPVGRYHHSKERPGAIAGRARQEKLTMGSVNPPKKRDYGHKTRIDLNQSYQVAYWKDRFGVSEQELSEAVLAAGALARKVEAYLKSKQDR
jgi:hypothetical protein